MMKETEDEKMNIMNSFWRPPKKEDLKKHYERLWLDMELMRAECEGEIMSKERKELARELRELTRELRKQEEKKG